MFSPKEMKHFECLARQEADYKVGQCFHPLDRQSREAKKMWERVYMTEMQARIYCSPFRENH